MSILEVGEGQSLVTIYVPKTGTTWRMTYYVDGVRRYRTAQSREAALRKAAEQSERLKAGTTTKSEQPVSALLAYWLDPQRPKPRKGGWSTSHTKQMQRYARVHFAALAKVRCADLRVRHLQQVVDATGSDDEGDRVRRAALSLIRAGRQGGYLLDSQQFDLRDVRRHGSSAAEVRSQGELDGFVPLIKRPSHAQVVALAEACRYPLAVYLAAYSGVRLGELLALTFEDVDGRTIRVHWQKNDSSPDLQRPKMSKTRTTLFRAEPGPGVDLLGMLSARCAEARAEREAGTNPHGLLFPTGRGTYWSQSNWHRDVVTPAMEAAGWPKMPEGQHRVWVMSWHSLRHRFCTAALNEWGLSLLDVCLLAGHESVQTTSRLYIGAMEDSLARMLEATQ